MNPFIRVLLLTFIFVGVVFAQNTVDVSRIQLQVTLSGHLGTVNQVVYSPNGKFVASAGEDGTVRIWDVIWGIEVQRFYGHSNAVTNVAFSPDSRLIASGHYDSLRVWDLAEGKLVRVLNVEGTKKSDYYLDIDSLTFRPDGRYLLTGNVFIARLWEVKTGRLVREFQSKLHTPQIVRFTSDSRTFVSTGWEKSIVLWDIQTGREIRRIQGTNGTEAISLSKDGKTAITTGYYTVRLWNLISGQLERQISLQNVISALFLADERFYITCTLGGEIAVWNRQTGTIIRRFGTAAKLLQSCDLSFDKKNLVTGDQNGAIRLWSIANARQTQETLFGHSGRVTGIVFSADSKTLLTVGPDNSARLWNAVSGAEIGRFTAGYGAMSAVAINSSNTVIATNNDGIVRLWDYATRRLIRELKDNFSSVCCLKFTANNTLLVSGNDDGTIKFWRVSDGKKIRQSQGHKASITSLALSPDGRLMASSGRDSTLRVWDALTGLETRQLDVDDNFSSGFVAFSLDGRTLATNDSFEVKLWDTNTWKELKKLQGHTGSPIGGDFSPDSKVLVTASSFPYDGSVRLWNVASGREIGQLSGHYSDASSLAFSPDGTRVAVGGLDTIRIYALPDTSPVFNQQTSPSFTQSIKPNETRENLDVTLLGCFRENVVNSKVVTCRVNFSLDNGELPIQLLGVRGVDESARISTAISQYGFLLPSVASVQQHTLFAGLPLTLEFSMVVPVDATNFFLLEMILGSPNQFKYTIKEWGYTARFTQVPIGR